MELDRCEQRLRRGELKSTMESWPCSAGVRAGSPICCAD